jgi:hypothetical protein
MVSEGAILFYVGIMGVGLSISVGLILFGLLSKSKKRLKDELERKYWGKP